MSGVVRTTVGDVASQGDVVLVDGSLPSELEELKDLLAEGQERGYLTHEEIAARLEDVDVSEEQVRDFHTQLTDQGIDVVSAELVADQGPGAQDADAPVADSDRPQAPTLDLSVEPSLDSL